MQGGHRIEISGAKRHCTPIRQLLSRDRIARRCAYRAHVRPTWCRCGWVHTGYVRKAGRYLIANIARILAEADMTAAHLRHVSAYVTDRAHMAGYMAARDAFLAGVPVLPTSAPLIVSGFTRPEFVVEVEVWAAAT